MMLTTDNKVVVEKSVERSGAPPVQVVEEVRERHVPNKSDKRMAGLERAASGVKFVAGIVNALIAFRFSLLLMGANRGNEFANFIFDLSRPLVYPFLTLFGSNPELGLARLELPDLVAIAFYSLIALGFVKMLKLGFAPGDPSGRAYRS